ncbi:MAG: hypothetical protein GYB31_18385 [Bacteroidetes bacterium]|nr:hypothetical protein [Bacteroidota bacterium]
MKKYLSLFAIIIFPLSGMVAQNDLPLRHFLGGASSAAPGTPVYLTRSSGQVQDDRAMLLNEKFEPAKVYINDTTVIEVQARYNIKLDRMEYLAGVDTIRQIYPQQVELVVLNNAIFLPREYYRDFTIRIGWFEVLTAGDISLLLQREAFKRKTDYNPGTMKLDNYEWDSRPAYYYLPQGEDMPTYFYVSKKNLLEIFGDNKRSMKEFMKENKIRIRKPGQLQILFTKYNQIAAGKG